MDYKPLYRSLGYTFKNKDLLDLALTHRSYASPHNERLEFLGDAVLGLSMAERLYLQYPGCTEGQLTKMRSHLVQGKTLCVMANELGVGPFLRLGTGELKTGGRERDSILEDVVEAIIGAIFLDSDIETAKSIVQFWFEKRLATVSADDAAPRDSKSKLQEYTQGNGHDLPEYETVSIDGKDHNQVFNVVCRINTLGAEAKGVGKNRKNAEQEAAKALISVLKI